MYVIAIGFLVVVGCVLFAQLFKMLFAHKYNELFQDLGYTRHLYIDIKTGEAHPVQKKHRRIRPGAFLNRGELLVCITAGFIISQFVLS